MVGFLENRKNGLMVMGFIFFLFIANFSEAQNVWRRHSGDTLNNAPVYGEKGVRSPSNFPGGRYSGASWTDLDGNFWLLGGVNVGSLASNDLWRYEVDSNQWTWMHGDGRNGPGDAVYGIKGVPDTGNTPGHGEGTQVSWRDNDGNFWLFGGSRNPTALWKYDVETNMWMWMQGDNVSEDAVYGTKGIPAPENTPGKRVETSCAWVDKENNLWMFGGRGRGADTVVGELNDLWKYNTTTNEWTWINGSNKINVPATYGQKGVPAASNNPGGRELHSNWIDADGNLWLFGGQVNIVTQGNFKKSDLWKYNPTTDMWTWVHGSDLLDPPGRYGEKCVSTPFTQPSGHFENKAVWVDNCDHAWLFGGWVLPGRGPANDLWRYNRFTNEFTWVRGDSIGGAPPVFGIEGAADSTNSPAGVSGYNYWHGKDGRFWITGGSTDYRNNRNVMWNYEADGVQAEFIIDTITEFPGQINFIDSSFSACNEIKSYAWDFGVEELKTDISSDVNPTYFYPQPGTYNVKLVVTTCTGSMDSVTHPVKIVDAFTNVFVPNSFTPNADGVNDIFLPILGTKFKNYTFQVFNRWGELLFTTKDHEMGWDGKKKDKELAMGVYGYLIDYENSKGITVRKKGRVSLIR